MKKSFLLVALITVSIIVKAQSTSFQWAAAITGTNVRGISSAIDASGNIYTTGFFMNTADFDPGPATYTLASAGGYYDAFVVKLDPAGNFLWARRMGGTGNDYGTSAMLDASGNIITSGTFEGSVDFDPGPGTYSLTSPNTAIYISKLDASGNFIWAKGITGQGDVQPGYAITQDASGNIFSTGFFNYIMDFDPDPVATYTMYASSNCYMNMYISKLDASGNFLWAKQLVGTTNISLYTEATIAADMAGNAYIASSFSTTIDFDPGAGTTTLTPQGANDVFILKLDANGNFSWVKQIGGAANDLVSNISINASGNIYTTGYFGGTADFDPGSATQTLTSNGDFDIFVSKLDASGNYAWAKNMGGANWDFGYDVTTDAAGNVYTTGTFSTTADFDPGPGVYTLTQTPVDYLQDGDVFISKLDPSGNFVWAKQLKGQSPGGRGQSIDVDLSGNVYTSGFFEGTFDFNEEPGVYNLTAPVGYSCFVHKMSQSIATGMDEAIDKNLSVYPNPTGSILNIELDPGKADELNIQILNSLGQVLISDNPALSDIYQYHLDQLPAGIYLVKISSRGEEIASKKIIHQ